MMPAFTASGRAAQRSTTMAAVSGNGRWGEGTFTPNRRAAADQLRLATQRYRLGAGSFMELLDAQVAAEQAESDYISAVYNYHRFVAALEAAVGHPIR